MQKSLIAISFSLLLYLLVSCSSTKNIAGIYRSNFAVIGFFGTTIRLKHDSSLQYVSRGDMMYDSATGHYSIHDRKVYINFDKVPPNINFLSNRFNFMPLKKAIILHDTIPYQLFCYIGHNKLFESHIETGKKVTKEFGYSKRKKYLIFGSHYYKRRYYLKRLTSPGIQP